MRILFLLFLCAMLSACNSQSQRSASNRAADTLAMRPCPQFNADSALASIEAQCAFGSRVPGTQAWRQCSEWIEAAFKQAGCEVKVQAAEVLAWDGSRVPCRNIIASLRPETSDRILLCAHWDSRPWADNDADEANHRKPVMAANDGASGVAVMLELARHLAQDTALSVGIDFVCFDVEDMGTPQWAETNEDGGETWCLGSEYWAMQAREAGYEARYGILFDMVGGRGARFAMEGISRHFAEAHVQRLWQTARQLGFGDFFVDEDGGFITDDHLNLNRIARIPTIDIVPYHEDGPSVFGPTWHTTSDTPENIDTRTLKAVGQSVLQMIYNDNL